MEGDSCQIILTGCIDGDDVHMPVPRRQECEVLDVEGVDVPLLSNQDCVVPSLILLAILLVPLLKHVQ